MCSHFLHNTLQLTQYELKINIANKTTMNSYFTINKLLDIQIFTVLIQTGEKSKVTHILNK
jgi:hypothetical protein